MLTSLQNIISISISIITRKLCTSTSREMFHLEETVTVFPSVSITSPFLGHSINQTPYNEPIEPQSINTTVPEFGCASRCSLVSPKCCEWSGDKLKSC